MAVTLVAPGGLGVVKPLGVAMLRTVEPEATGWKRAEVKEVSGEKLTGLVMVPTPGTELEIVTLTDKPLRIDSRFCSVSVEGPS